MRHAQVLGSMPSPEDRGSVIVRAVVSARGLLGSYSSAAQLRARPRKSLILSHEISTIASRLQHLPFRAVEWRYT